MKSWSLFFVLFFCGLTASAQVDSTTPPYKKFPTLPPFQILLGDSTTKYTKAQLPEGKPVVFFVFSPECIHCQQEAEQLFARRNELKGIQVVMATMYPLWQMNDFIKKYRLNEIPEVVAGKDIFYIMAPFYDIRILPYHATYDKKGNLIQVYEGPVELSKVLGTVKGK